MNNNYKCWYSVDLDISNAIRADINFEKLKSWNLGHQDPNSNILMWAIESDELDKIFNEVWLEYMESMNLRVFKLMLFYRKPNFQDIDAHIDISDHNYENGNIAINWVVNLPAGYDDSEMVWYDMPEYTDDDVLSYTPVKTSYISYDIVTLNKIDSRSIGSTPTLVRVDIPHSIRMGNTGRFGFSVRVHASEIPNIENPSWESLVDYFKDKGYITV